jgi:hypothetical protein
MHFVYNMKIFGVVFTFLQHFDRPEDEYFLNSRRQNVTLSDLSLISFLGESSHFCVVYCHSKIQCGPIW